ncbi:MULTISPECIES: guanylate kinase [Carnobacterium]|jgi:guanylate kinase|uniref:Guanylate kinase n=1 Tax=Carnobacterium maltaromaticum LMA28 TaxID=1234679 RepID=K8EQZ5_CARML|nr:MULTISPECIES: guanylate kinase [Carnobacterium]AOA01839.1 guanylate kinase [Carnobacterium maltaromaticum]KRN64716.1 guanylate kinase [Carnobacterium maltaromaticum DSM 20342]KRN74092.1 guanylate kinase [Carnobacterium maltaromaticum]KRN87598.1 guanylate kinase [Carnobacterium maltaromaticum]MBC9788006.1 guanylate kinase [Carnobacterium maltaromaticum]
MTDRGLLIVLSGPSGVGKGTVRQAIFENDGTNFDYSISMTTRKKRVGETDGVDYFFRTKEEFETLIENGGLLEYAEYVGNYYGTPLAYVEETLASGKDVFLEIEVQGALQVREKMPEGVFIFLTPPDLVELKSRIIGRGTDEMAVIEERMEKAIEEIEMMRLYDYAVVNDQVENAVRNVKQIIESEHLRVSRVIHRYKKMIEEL